MNAEQRFKIIDRSDDEHMVCIGLKFPRDILLKRASNGKKMFKNVFFHFFGRFKNYTFLFNFDTFYLLYIRIYGAPLTDLLSDLKETF